MSKMLTVFVGVALIFMLCAALAEGVPISFLVIAATAVMYAATPVVIAYAIVVTIYRLIKGTATRLSTIGILVLAIVQGGLYVAIENSESETWTTILATALGTLAIAWLAWKPRRWDAA